MRPARHLQTAVIYPSEGQITDYFSNLPTTIGAEFATALERAQGNYRRVWQLAQVAGKDDRVRVLSQFAGDLFMTRAAKRLEEHAGEFEQFRAAISLNGGDAELAFWFAHRLYNLVERGRMLSVWHRQIESHLWDRIREAENLWYTPDLVPDCWRPFLEAAQGSQERPEISAGERPAETAESRRAPAEYFEAYRAKNPGISYRKLAGRIGISYESLFTIKGEMAWVRDYAYAAAAGELGCSPEDLHPRHLPRLPRRPRSGSTRTKIPQ